MPPAKQPAVPARFNVLRRIGEGGMGVVYEAMDVERGVRVALKTVLHRDADALARFKHEFRTLQDIHHPNLVSLGELIGDAGDVFFTMELVEGVDLRTYIRGEGTLPSAIDAPTAMDLREQEPDTFVQPFAIPEGAVVPSTGENATFVTDPPSGTVAALHPGGFDEDRLRDAFRQIALGLSALHDAQRIHRDVKPSNVRVTPEGRVVLLDFGLVFESGAPNRSMDLSVVGTPAFMAPEQAASSPVGPPADWYSLGVMLYQCLAGRLPFEGAALAVLMAKQYKAPLAPSAFVVGVPADLNALCMELLRFDPAARPSGADVLRRLDAKPDGRRPVSVSSHPGATTFVGRASELAELDQAFAQAAVGAVTVALYGESGVGKSCLVRRFLETTADTRPEPMILTGRCYEREAVPYKAFDEVIDTLSRRLARLESEEAQALLPPNVEELAQLFPALCRVPSVSQGIASLDVDPHERRRTAFRALRTLFGRIAAERRLIIAIDDLQWTDADSLSLLVDLLSPPDAPRILLLATLRRVEGANGRAEPPAFLASLPGDVRSVNVGRLDPTDAKKLAARLLERASPGHQKDAAAIADEAAGHPLFIDELVRHAALSSRGAEIAPRLDDALWARVQRLQPPVRRVLDIACVIGTPMAQEIVAQASGLEMREFSVAVALLRTSNLVKTSGARVTDAIEPYHDRVREAVVARLEPDVRSARHERIAAALEASKAYDAETLSIHWAGAGQITKASRFAVVAAEQATQALAFDRAARLYQHALDLAPEDPVRRRALRKLLADALANTGQGPLAAAEYERATVGASAGDALELRRRAAEQLLRSGEIEPGLAVTRVVLAGVGLSLPRSMVTAVLRLLWYRFLLTLRGSRFTPRDEADIAPSELTRIDVCWSVSFTVSYADVIRGSVFQTMHLLLALRAGEPLRIARAMAMESSYLGALGEGAWGRTERAIVRARELADRTGQPYARAIALACAGIAHCMHLRFVPALELLEPALEIFREKCPGSAWEITTTQFFIFVSMSYCCRYVELRQRLEIALKGAIDRGDHYGAIMLRVGVLNRIWWLGGDAVRARQELAEAARAWPSGGYQMIHFHLAVGESFLDLFEGAWERAHDRVVAQGPALKRALLLQVDAVRLEWLGVRVRTSIAAAAAAGMREDQSDRRDALLREADGYMKEYALTNHPLNRAMYLSARASIAATRGRLDEARRIIEQMSTAEDSEEGWVARECARWLLGRLRGGPEGEELVRATEARLASRGVAGDRRIPLVLFPGLAPHV